MKTANKILIEFGLRKQLLEHGSYPTIEKALEGDIRTLQMRTIRKRALELGAIEIRTKKTLTDIRLSMNK